MTISGLLNYKYGWELTAFNKIRNFKDGISFINFDVNLDLYKADHKPSFATLFVLFNYTIIEFLIYNVNHTDSSCDNEGDNCGC